MTKLKIKNLVLPTVNEYKPSTLCEICENACGGCSWSEKNVQKPVEGWEAIRNDIMPHGYYSEPIESYVVLECPEYEPDKYAEKYPFNKKEAERRAIHRAMITQRVMEKQNERKKHAAKAFA